MFGYFKRQMEPCPSSQDCVAQHTSTIKCTKPRWYATQITITPPLPSLPLLSFLSIFLCVFCTPRFSFCCHVLSVFLPVFLSACPLRVLCVSSACPLRVLCVSSACPLRVLCVSSESPLRLLCVSSASPMSVVRGCLPFFEALTFGSHPFPSSLLLSIVLIILTDPLANDVADHWKSNEKGAIATGTFFLILLLLHYALQLFFASLILLFLAPLLLPPHIPFSSSPLLLLSPHF